MFHYRALGLLLSGGLLDLQVGGSVDGSVRGLS